MVSRNTDQVKADQFLSAFSSQLTQKFPRQIDFIFLFGSAARGGFVAGKSDVDLIIQVKDEKDVEKVNKIALSLFWKLDKKYQTRLKEVCSIGKGENDLDQMIKKIESHARLYKPFEVFGPNDLDWKKGHINRPDLFWGGVLVASQLTLFYKMKSEGKVLCGRNILTEINPHRSWWEKFKSLIIPQHLAFGGVLLALILPKRAQSYAIKSVLWELESALIVMNQFHDDRKKQLKNLRKVLNQELIPTVFNQVNFLEKMGIKPIAKSDQQWVYECLKIKKNEKKLSRIETLFMACQSLCWVLRVRFWTSVKELFQ